MPVKADNEEEGAEEFWRSDLEDEGDVDLAEMHMQQAIEASMRPDDGYKSLENEILGIGQPAPRVICLRCIEIPSCGSLAPHDGHHFY